MKVCTAGFVAAARGGDEDAWSRLVESFAGLLNGVARAHRLNEADAADVAQTTWLRLLTGLDSLEQPSRLAAWLATTARRESLRVLRSSRLQVPVDVEALAREAAEEDPVWADHEHALRRALSRLRPPERRLLRLLFADPAPSYAEIAEQLGIPIGSIGPTRRRCLQRLREELAGI